MVKILRHYLPDLQLSLPTLRSLSTQLENLSDKDAPLAPECQGSPETPASDGDHAEVHVKESPSIEEIQTLHEQLGCLMIDSRGNYRTAERPDMALTRSNRT